MSKSTPKCYIDSNVIIDYVAGSFNELDEGRKEEMEYVSKILNSARGSQIQLYTSSVTKMECYHIGDKSCVAEEVKNIFKSIFNSGVVIREIPVSGFVTELVRDMRWENFPLPNSMDTIHIASAIFAHCDEIITFDGFRREAIKKKKQDDEACIVELCKQHNISVVYPSESVVSKMECVEYVAKLKELQKKEDRKKKPDDEWRRSLLDISGNESKRVVG
jgi:predicted nucleic acid-binding protein